MSVAMGSLSLLGPGGRGGGICTSQMLQPYSGVPVRNKDVVKQSVMGQVGASRDGV